MTQLRVVRISAPKITQEMFTHLLMSTRIQCLAYRTNRQSSAFEESAFENPNSAVTDLTIDNVTGPDNQVLIPISSRLKKLALARITGGSDIQARQLRSMLRCDQLISLVMTVVGSTLSSADVFNFLWNFPNVEDLEVNTMFDIPPGALRRVGTRHRHLLPKLQRLRSEIAFAEVLVPSRPIKDLFICYPTKRENRVHVEPDTLITLSTGSTPLQRLHIQGSFWHEDLLARIAVLLPTLTMLTLELDPFCSAWLEQYLLEPTQPLPAQLQRFGSWSGEASQYAPDNDFYSEMSAIRPSLNEVCIQSIDLWTKLDGIVKCGPWTMEQW